MEQFIELITKINTFELIGVILWGLAGAVSFHFSIVCTV